MIEEKGREKGRKLRQNRGDRDGRKGGADVRIGKKGGEEDIIGETVRGSGKGDSTSDF